MELIVVDNASIDDTSNWVQQHHSKIKLIQLNQPRSLASALNTGISHSTGFYFLLLNPDTELQQNAVAELLRFAEQSPRCAAVAAKLKLSWAPAFLNGFGNYVGAVTWGTDIGLGHLDLGQFDSVNEVPSACFAAALINKKVYEDVGPFDEEFPLYYEDSEWCYRARIYGYHVLAAPKAVVYHAFGGLTKEVNNEMAARKIGRVVYGRLRFINKILSPRFYIRFTLLYFFEDLFNLLGAFFRRQWGNVRAYFEAYSHFFRSLPELLIVRTQIQSHRKISDKELFTFQQNLPMTLTWHGNPMLTWDLVYHHYLPLIISGKTRSLPEFEGIDLGEIKLEETGNLVNQIKRANQILKVEGFSMLIHRIGRVFQSNFS